MSKQKETEVAVDSNALIAADNPANALLTSMLQAEQNLPETTKQVVLPRLTIYMPGKKYTEKGASHGFVIDYNDGERVEVNVSSLRLHRLDAHIQQRIMWEFDPNTGKRVQDSKDPWCASSNGVSARKAPIFNYIGKEYFDWRTGRKETILEDNCANCPFSKWVQLLDKNGNPVVENDEKGVLVAKNGAPMCMETPTWIFFDVDRKIFLVYQASNFSARIHALGARKSRWGFLKGINHWYDTNNGTKVPDVFDDKGNLYPLEFSVIQVSNAPFGFTPVPKFTKANAPYSPKELELVMRADREYKEYRIREIVSGDLFTAYTNEEEAPAVTTNQPF